MPLIMDDGVGFKTNGLISPLGSPDTTVLFPLMNATVSVPARLKKTEGLVNPKGKGDF